jgi:hypothetical protein
MLKTWRGWMLFLVVLLLVFGVSGPSAMADDECRVDLGRGWSAGTGAGKIVMKNNQKRCGSSLYTVPQDQIVVDAIQVAKPPQNGTIAIEIPKFFYTPKAGFAGSDRFTLKAEGPDAGGRRVKLMGEVTVQVNP